MKLKIISVAHHRNGVGGAPFYVVLFDDWNPKRSRKVAVLFEDPYHCAVLDVALLAAGDIAFGSNSWRGDDYEPQLRQKIGEAPADPRTPIVIEVRGGVVQEVKNVPPGYLYEIRDHDDLTEEQDDDGRAA